MDLKTPLVTQNKLHANFRALITPGFFDEEWNTLHKWSDGFVDRDGKFVREFQTTFNSSFWELYLHAAFRELGFVADYSFNRPDFVLRSTAGTPVVAEAVIASHADGYCPEWRRSLSQLVNADREETIHIATIRLASAIWSKYKKLKESYAELNHVKGKPFVICAAPFEQPTFFMQNDNALRRVLYGFDQPLWIPAPDGSRMPIGQSSLPEIIKDNGATIPLGFFTSAMMPEVSAVIFSNTATITKVRALTKNGKMNVILQASRYNANGSDPHNISKPRAEFEETLLDGLHVCVNPFANHPLDLEPFQGREIAIHFYDRESGEYLPSSPDGFLFQHGSIGITSGSGLKELEEIATNEYKRPVYPLRKEKELFSVAGNVAFYIDNHLAHHRGWTIYVCRDTVDDDWMAQATTGTHGTLAAYHQADKSNLLLGESSYSTKEQAFEHILRELDRHLDKPLIEARRVQRQKAQRSLEKKQRRKEKKAERVRKKDSRRR